MALVSQPIDYGHGPVQWRAQGNSNLCWLTCIEMVMQWRHGNIYGVDADGDGSLRGTHAPEARALMMRDSVSSMASHWRDYNLVPMEFLRHHGIDGWRDAIRTYGPIIAEGRYGWARIGWGEHVIVVVGVSESGQIGYLNPNVMSTLPHPSSRLSYISLERLLSLADRYEAFWECRA